MKRLANHSNGLEFDSPHLHPKDGNVSKTFNVELEREEARLIFNLLKAAAKLDVSSYTMQIILVLKGKIEEGIKEIGG